jgi:hypothetical protein
MSTELVQARLLAMRLSRHFSSDHASMVLKTSKSSSPLTASTCGAGSEIERGCRAEAASRSKVYDSKHQNQNQCLLTTCRNTKPHQALVRSTSCTSDKSENEEKGSPGKRRSHRIYMYFGSDLHNRCCTNCFREFFCLSAGGIRGNSN